MRLFSGKINAISEEIVKALTATGDMEVESTAEVELDIQSVLKEYLRVEREVNEEAKNRMEARGMGYSQLGKMKSQVAKERNTVTGDETLPYLIDQILEMLFHSQNVSEVFAEDADLRKKIAPIMRKHMDVEGELDQEVRAKIKNLQEGTAAFDVEYAKMMEQIKRNKGLG